VIAVIKCALRVAIVGFHDDGVRISLQEGEGNFPEPTFVLDNFGVHQGWKSVEDHPLFLVKTIDAGNVDIVRSGP